jgi:hypothetical protein
MGNVIVEDLDCTPEEIYQIIYDHVAYHEAQKAKKVEQRRQLEIKKTRSSLLGIIKHRLSIEAEKLAILRVINKRLQEEKQKEEQAAWERMEAIRANDPNVQKVRTYWGNPVAPKTASSIRLFA